MSEENQDELQLLRAKDNVEEKEEKLNCNGDMPRTSEPSKDGSTSINRELTEFRDNTEASGGELCSPIDTKWAGDGRTVSSSKDPSCNNHNSDSTSSEDETEGGGFAANWYVPLPQDPQQSDKEEEGEDSEQWRDVATGAALQAHQDEEEEVEGQGASDRVKEIQPASRMEDSELFNSIRTKRALGISQWNEWFLKV